MPVSEEGHQYSFGPPAGGWPSFGPDGHVQKDYDAAAEAAYAENGTAAFEKYGLPCGRCGHFGCYCEAENGTALVGISAPDGRLLYVREEHAQELWDLLASGASNDEIDEWVAEVLS